MSYRLLTPTLLLVVAGGMRAQDFGEKQMEAPALPYVAKNVCPFEYCVYREWTALKDMPLYDTWEGTRKRIATLRPTDKVTALGGVVLTERPGVIHMDRDVPEAKLRLGDTILTYGYTSEGFSSVWLQGRFFEAFDISFTKWPDGSGCGGAHCAATFVDLGKKSWWVQLKLTSGVTGWVDMEGFVENSPFRGMSHTDLEQPSTHGK